MKLILNRRYRGKIEKIPLPAQTGTLTYNGKAQSPAWLNYDSSKMIMSGTTSSINAGTFTAIFTPKKGCCWQDGSRDAKNVTWRIGKATPVLSLERSSLQIVNNNHSGSYTRVSCVSDGAPVISITGITEDAILKRVETTTNGIAAYIVGIRQDEVQILITLKDKILGFSSNVENDAIQLSCTVYMKETANYNASNTCGFSVYSAKTSY